MRTSGQMASIYGSAHESDGPPVLVGFCERRAGSRYRGRVEGGGFCREPRHPAPWRPRGRRTTYVLHGRDMAPADSLSPLTVFQDLQFAKNILTA